MGLYELYELYVSITRKTQGFMTDGFEVEVVEWLRESNNNHKSSACFVEKLSKTVQYYSDYVGAIDMWAIMNMYVLPKGEETFHNPESLDA